jgi:hypothetical protein
MTAILRFELYQQYMMMTRQKSLWFSFLVLGVCFSDHFASPGYPFQKTGCGPPHTVSKNRRLLLMRGFLWLIISSKTKGFFKEWGVASCSSDGPMSTGQFYEQPQMFFAPILDVGMNDCFVRIMEPFYRVTPRSSRATVRS